MSAYKLYEGSDGYYRDEACTDKVSCESPLLVPTGSGNTFVVLPASSDSGYIVDTNERFAMTQGGSGSPCSSEGAGYLEPLNFDQNCSHGDLGAHGRAVQVLEPPNFDQNCSQASQESFFKYTNGQQPYGNETGQEYGVNPDAKGLYVIVRTQPHYHSKSQGPTRSCTGQIVGYINVTEAVIVDEEETASTQHTLLQGIDAFYTEVDDEKLRIGSAACQQFRVKPGDTVRFEVGGEATANRSLWSNFTVIPATTAATGNLFTEAAPEQGYTQKEYTVAAQAGSASVPYLLISSKGFSGVSGGNISVALGDDAEDGMTLEEAVESNMSLSIGRAMMGIIRVVAQQSVYLGTQKCYRDANGTSAIGSSGTDVLVVNQGDTITFSVLSAGTDKRSTWDNFHVTGLATISIGGQVTPAPALFDEPEPDAGFEQGTYTVSDSACGYYELNFSGGLQAKIRVIAQHTIYEGREDFYQDDIGVSSLPSIRLVYPGDSITFYKLDRGRYARAGFAGVTVSSSGLFVEPGSGNNEYSSGTYTVADHDSDTDYYIRAGVGSTPPWRSHGGENGTMTGTIRVGTGG